MLAPYLGQAHAGRSSKPRACPSRLPRPRPPSRGCHSLFAVECAPAPEVDGRVMHKVPDHLAEDDILALVDLGGLDDLLLKCSRIPPVDHVARSFVFIGGQDEAGIVRTQARCEHTRTPWPPCLDELGISTLSLGLLQSLDALDSMHGLLLTRVRDLGNRRQNPLAVFAHDAPRIAVTHSEDCAITPC